MMVKWLPGCKARHFPDQCILLINLCPLPRYCNGELVVPKVVVASPISAYENTLEVESLDQLEDIISDPDEMRMQALLVRERILGPAHPDTSYYIRYRGAVYADMGHFERCITLWMYALDMQQKMLEPLSPMTQSSLLSFAELFRWVSCFITCLCSVYRCWIVGVPTRKKLFSLKPIIAS